MKPFARRLSLIAAALLCSSVGPRACAVDTNSTVRSDRFQFDSKISRQVLENYLSRSICIEGMLNGRGPLVVEQRNFRYDDII